MLSPLIISITTPSTDLARINCIISIPADSSENSAMFYRFDQFLKVFAATTEIFKQQPGFISAQLHRGIGGSSTFFNYVVRESAEHFKQAFNRPEFRSSMADVLPNTIMSPHLFKKVAVPGICVD